MLSLMEHRYGSFLAEMQQMLKPQAASSAPAETVTLTLDMDIAKIPAGSDQRHSFERRFLADLAKSTGVSSSRFKIIDVAPGSVVVTVRIEGGTSGPTPAQLKKIIMEQVALQISS